MTECMKSVLIYLGKNGTGIRVDSIKIKPFNFKDITSAVKSLKTIGMIEILTRKYVDEPTSTIIITEITQKGYSYLSEI